MSVAIKLSTGARNALLSTNDFQGVFASCFIDVFTGSQPTSADAAPTGTLLLTYSVNHDGVTGGTWANASGGQIDKTASEHWQAIGLSDASAGWFRVRKAGDLGTTNTTDVRMDGSIAFSGSNWDMPDTNVVTGRSYSIDSFIIDLAANA